MVIEKTLIQHIFPFYGFSKTFSKPRLTEIDMVAELLQYSIASFYIQ